MAACSDAGESWQSGEEALGTRSAVVATDGGSLRGVPGNAFVSFKGIPFAAPPVGDLRFRAPEPPAPWSGVRDAASFGSPCVAISSKGELRGGDEDCLTLNVWTPSLHPAKPLPVMVYVHGGFYLLGSASDQFKHPDGTLNGTARFDGAWLAANKDVLVVTLQYRLGALGFFAHPALAREGDEAGQGSGNYAMLDQIAALRWVQTNIAKFGGDPERVLLFGQSAGGASACALLASPLARGLFSRAIIQSGACGISDRTAAEQAATSASKALGCESAPDPLACLRAKPAAEVATAVPPSFDGHSYRWSPTVDGHFLKRAPSAALRRGEIPEIPIVFGNTADEYSTLGLDYFPKWPRDDAEYREAIKTYFGPERADAVLAKYPSAKSDPKRALIQVLTDHRQVCPTRRWARAAAGHTKTWRYLFAHTYASSPSAAFRAGHGLELPFLFHNFGPRDFEPNEDELKLADAMTSLWTEFAKTGDPGAAGGATWAPYDAGKDDYIALDDEVEMRSGLRGELCDFWDALPSRSEGGQPVPEPEPAGAAPAAAPPTSPELRLPADDEEERAADDVLNGGAPPVEKPRPPPKQAADDAGCAVGRRGERGGASVFSLGALVSLAALLRRSRAALRRPSRSGSRSSAA